MFGGNPFTRFSTCVNAKLLDCLDSGKTSYYFRMVNCVFRCVLQIYLSAILSTSTYLCLKDLKSLVRSNKNLVPIVLGLAVVGSFIS